MDNDFPMFMGARPKRSFADAYRQAADVFKQKLTQGELGPEKVPNMFGPAQGLLQFATGQGIKVGDESGTAIISPGGGFSLAGKYNEFTIDPFMRKVGAKFINPESDFSVGGSIGMGPQGFYDPSAELNFQIGGFNQQSAKMPEKVLETEQNVKINPITGDQIFIDERGYTSRIPYAFRQDVMPTPYKGPLNQQEGLQLQGVSPARLLEMQQTQQYRQQNSYYQ